jgi:prepilin-type N-terminal cleavage/methylation domain-containing protein
MYKRFVQAKGFTLIELILVVLILGILAAVTMTSLRPSQQLANQRDAQRKADLLSILNAIKQYSIDNNGSLPSTIQLDSNCLAPATFAEICKTGNAILMLISLLLPVHMVRAHGERC